MKRAYKFVLAVLTIALVLALVGCGQPQSPATEQTTPAPETAATEAPVETQAKELTTLELDTANKESYAETQAERIKAGELNELANDFEWYVHHFTYSLEEVGITDQASEIHYRLFAPKNTVEGEKYPLVVFMHGASQVGYDNYAQVTNTNMAWAYEQWQEEHPCYVMLVQLPREGEFSFETENRHLLEYTYIIEEIAEAFGNVDMDRIYATGYSFGGVNTYMILAQRPDFFAAGLVLNGTPVHATNGDLVDLEKILNVPLYVLHGAMDPYIGCDEAAYSAYNRLAELGKKDMTYEVITEAGLEALNKEIGSDVFTAGGPGSPSGHGTPNYAYARVLYNVNLADYGKTDCMEWLFSHVKGDLADTDPVLIQWDGADYATKTGYTITGWAADLESPDIGLTGSNDGDGDILIARWRICGPDGTAWDASSNLEDTTLKAGDEIYVWLQGYAGLYGNDFEAYQNEWDTTWRIISGSVANVELVNTHPQALTDKYVGLAFANGGGPMTKDGTLLLEDGQVFLKITLADDIPADEQLHMVVRFESKDGYVYYETMQRDVKAQ